MLLQRVWCSWSDVSPVEHGFQDIHGSVTEIRVLQQIGHIHTGSTQNIQIIQLEIVGIAHSGQMLRSIRLGEIGFIDRLLRDGIVRWVGIARHHIHRDIIGQLLAEIVQHPKSLLHLVKHLCIELLYLESTLQRNLMISLLLNQVSSNHNLANSRRKLPESQVRHVAEHKLLEFLQMLLALVMFHGHARHKSHKMVFVVGFAVQIVSQIVDILEFLFRIDHELLDAILHNIESNHLMTLRHIVENDL